MNKKLSLLIGLLLCINYSFSQCTPDGQYTAMGIYPDSLSGLLAAYPFVHYEQVITVNVPADTLVNLPGIGFLTLTVNYLKLDSLKVINLNGDTVSLSTIDFYYTCNPSDCSFPGGTSSCILLSGDPTYGTPENNSLIFYLTLNVTHPSLGTFDAPQSVYNDYNVNAHIPPIDIITGTVYDDQNLNCIQDIGEMGIPGIVVVVTPGNNYALTDTSGHYAMRPDSIGLHTVSHIAQTYYVNTCPQPSFTYTVDIDTLNQTNSNINFGDTVNHNIYDMRVILTANSNARQGMPAYYQIALRNMGTSFCTGTLNLQYNPQHLTYTIAEPAETSVGANTISWDFDSIAPGYSVYYSVQFMVNVPTGTPLHFEAYALPFIGDTMPYDNTDILNQVVTASYDPNVKEVVPATDIDHWNVWEQPRLTYTIHFQNTGNDTAFTVVLRDTISNNLSMETFELLTSSHPVTLSLNYPRELVFTFNNILLPDSTTNEPASHGFVKYRIRTNDDLVIYDEIRNTASIYFDFNDPVVTNTTITEIVMQPGFAENAINSALHIYPNPNTGIITLETAIAKGTYQLYDITGKTLLQGSVTSTKFTLDISTLSSGVYFISVSDADKQLYGKVVRE